MESLGMPGRIHVSEATAQEPMGKGKGHWLTLREDKVVVSEVYVILGFCLLNQHIRPHALNSSLL